MKTYKLKNGYEITYSTFYNGYQNEGRWWVWDASGTLRGSCDTYKKAYAYAIELGGTGR